MKICLKKSLRMSWYTPPNREPLSGQEIKVKSLEVTISFVEAIQMYKVLTDHQLPLAATSR